MTYQAEMCVEVSNFLRSGQKRSSVVLHSDLSVAVIDALTHPHLLPTTHTHTHRLTYTIVLLLTHFLYSAPIFAIVNI